MAQANDERVEFIAKRIRTTYPKLQGNKFDKAWQTEENMDVLDTFMNSPERFLVVNDNARAMVRMPPKMGKNKLVLFVKTASNDLSKDPQELQKQLLILELGGLSAFEHLELLSNEIFLPVLSNTGNQAKWGEVATREIMDRFYSFLSQTTILCGQIKGETRLPMPPLDMNDASNGKSLISLLEGAIITWTKQIKSVLKQDPESQLKQGMHPTPDVEIEFWKSKANNLNSIFEQLQSQRIRRVLRALDQSKSTYCQTFSRLCKEVFAARMEANDNMKYLRTLDEWFTRLNTEDDFPKLLELFKPMLHIILLIWKNSKHYNTPARLVVLMREICNSLIAQACQYVSGEQIFALIEGENAAQAVEQLKTTLRVCGTFKSTYFDYKSTATAECPANPWRIQNNALFMRLDSFLERCHDILDLTQTIVQFSKLAKIEVGGTKGKTLTMSVGAIHSDFQNAINAFKKVPYDIMDVGAKQFDDDFYEFRCSIKELERRLGAVVSLAFDDCATVYGRFKLFDSFEGLLERPIIQDELEKKYVSLVQSFGADLKVVQEQFLMSRDDPPKHLNLPPIAGALTWCRGLIERIRIPMRKLQDLDRAILEREEAKEVNKVYKSIEASLQEYENQKIEEWGRDVEASSQLKLKLPLMVRHPETQHLSVNFDPALVRLLREVKYFLLLDLEVPQSAREIYLQVEVFRQWVGNLDLIVIMNNDVLQQLLPVEKPLVQPYLDKFNKTVEEGISTLNWKSKDIDEFIALADEQVQVVHEITTTMKDNLNHVNSIMEKWARPMMDRTAKPVDEQEFERTHKALKQARYAEIRDGGRDIMNHLKETNKVLRVSNASVHWRDYVDFVNNIVIDGLARVIVVSLEYLLDQIDPETIARDDKQPLLEITLDLVGTEAKFVPGVRTTDSGKDRVNGWIGSFFLISTLLKRLDLSDGNYMREMHTDYEVGHLLAIINDTLSQNEVACAALKSQFEEHSYLWVTDLPTYFREFTEEAWYTTENGGRYLDLAKYDKAITKYKNVKAAIQKLQSPEDVGWLRVNTVPIKQALVTLASTWIHMFTNRLKEYVAEKLTGLDEFMAKVQAGLDVEVDPDAGEAGKKALMDVMRSIRDVKKTMDLTQEMFEPLRECVQLLKQHGVTSDTLVNKQDVQDYLEDAPMHWDSVVKKTFKVREAINEMQNVEASALKAKLDQFFLDIREFRNDFRDKAPGINNTGGVLDAYSTMNGYAGKLFAIEREAQANNELEDLFELSVSKYPECADTRNELKQLKNLWDFKAMLESVYDQWRAALWSNINTELLEDENKKLLKALRNKGADQPIIKGWNVYRDIETIIKDMGVVLPLVNELHHPAMRERHWAGLAKVCGVDSVNPKDPKFTFADMMELQLETHVDDVSDIVETAQKEKKIEDKLRIIESEWASYELLYVQHKDTEMFVIKMTEEVIEALDAHQLELQTMIGMGKFVDFFRERVDRWQRTLGNVQETTKLWESVSRSWASLESIFLASADIRSQLPDDTKRFEGIDSEFKELMKNAKDSPNVVDACSVDGREEGLRSMKERLELCQKSLNEYLDVKKKIFPRFYFVSAVALLDMLANGTNPPKIIPYLGDCYDSLNDVTFVTDPATGEPSNKVVNEMIAKDKERLMMHAEFTMEGEVEVYLNNLTEAMRVTLKHSLNDGWTTAQEWEVGKDLPRHRWLFRFPAQVVCTGSQIYWTEESETALEELEGGQEDAVKRYLQLCKDRLAHLINLVLGQLEKGDRVKIITLITLDVHARDVVDKLIQEKIEGPTAFLWQQQLRFYWDNTTLDLFGEPCLDTNIKICDYKTKYFYEWVGNTGRLVITPLTDRCYITLTMGLRLFLGGAPAGPAGTGKTETTKDLARALAVPCYVYNCSDQMSYLTMADIFRGLSQTGAWGCFDEFNRIPIEVLSVVATQVKVIQDAVLFFSVPSNREQAYQHLPSGTPPVKVGMFDFFGDSISLIPTTSHYITMNPGYAGRTELPENLKALFRSCAMIRPDLKPICENMLMSEGFQKAKTLAIKFVTLYQLSGDLLSKQPHYDWGLRAVKSVLRVAGGMKRGEPDLDEAQILMRALRDFNTPKIPAHDTPVFLRLISDLFMGLEVQSKIDENLKLRVVRVAKETNLQYDDMFIQKTCQFQELLDVRHSVMLLGPGGCAKSAIWKTLAGTHNLDKPKKTCVHEVVNPKSVTGDELYGYMTLSKDWKDGVLSIIMRGMAKNLPDQGFHDYQTYKWVVLDGDIDAVWIESMNTVMDDNKVLTLVSNERVPLSDAMRMVFEISSLKNATPATVSRAGILYINESDIGWRPMMESWVQQREDAAERNALPPLFEKYVGGLIEMTRRGFKEVTPCKTINKVATIMYLLETLLSKMSVEEKTPDNIEYYFMFAAVWAFGGPQVADKQVDYRQKFSEEFASLFGQKYPKEGLVFDYFWDHKRNEHVLWSEVVPTYSAIEIGPKPTETPFTSVSVSTVDSVRQTAVIDMLVRNHKYAMLVGTAGTGKTLLIKEYLLSLDKDFDGLMSNTITMSYYTNSLKLQSDLELPIDKRAGRMFGPPATKHLIYFLDDLNLPEVETYGTQNAIALLTQLMAHRSIFDRSDLGFRKEIVDTQYLAAMNPTSGAFQICERAQWHFATFNCAMPGYDDLVNIYSSIFDGHLAPFTNAVQALSAPLIEATLQLHKAVQDKFLPSAIKFTYNWNMRELANIFQGLCLTEPQNYDAPMDMLRLWAHECTRVFADRMLSDNELQTFKDLMSEAAKKNFTKENGGDIFAEPLVYTNFANTTRSEYLPITDNAALKKTLDHKLLEYNETFAMMDLVLFEMAMQHVARITRILANPGGNAMLIGVGGMGKQCLCRLSSFILGYEVQQIQVTGTYSVNDLKENLQAYYRLAIVKQTPTVLLMTDGQIINDKFLVFINAILASGWISDLFPKEDVDTLMNALRADAKTANVPDNPESMFEFLVKRCRSMFKVVLAFSPVGDTFRVRARRFPGLINCTAIDVFHPWPRDALESVADRFLQEVEIDAPDPDAFKAALAKHMAEEHLSVTVASDAYRESQRRNNYVTPKSFLELISFYKALVDEKRKVIQMQIDRLDVGLSTLRKTAEDVAELEVDLRHTMVKVEEKKSDTDKLIQEMGVQRADAEEQQALAAEEKTKANIASAAAKEIQDQASAELAEAEPAMVAAKEAVDCLDKNMLTELKSFKQLPGGVDKVTAACLILVEHEYKNHKWDRAKKMMQNVDQFKQNLQAYKGETMPEDEVARIEPYINDADFTYESYLKKSAAAANLANWIINIYRYNRIYVKVKPLMDSLQAANDSKAAADASLAAAQATVDAVQEKLQKLQDKLQEATMEKQAVEDEAEACTARLTLAGRLVNGLSSENDRWAIEIEHLGRSAGTLAGDCMLAAGFVSYVGAFDQQNREKLWLEQWIPDLTRLGISLTPNTDPLTMLSSESAKTQMISEGLPNDRVSIENGTIICNCKRWPLIIDPQMQGIKWLREKEKDNGLCVFQLTQKNWLRKLSNAITNGSTIIIENVGEEIDATMDPVLSRAIIRKGRNLFLRLAGEEVEYDVKFRLYMQTKLANPHYKPEIAAQCTLINFIATERGLEDQLLARVVGKERPDLEKQSQDLQEASVAFKIQLLQLEDNLLERLANAPDDILSDVDLIDGLEETKQTANEINAQMAIGEETKVKIAEARESYRRQASEGAMLYFLLTKLCAIDHMYQYSLDSFVTFFYKSIDKAPAAQNVDDRVNILRETLRMTIFTWVSRGLFERHKLIFMSQLCFNLMRRNILGDDNQMNEIHFNFLMRGPRKLGEENPLEWLPSTGWQACQALGDLEEFGRFCQDLVEAAPRFREWYNHVTPETEKLPLDWSQLDRTPFQKMLVIRSLRPDRMTVALSSYVASVLPNGQAYAECDAMLSSVEVLDQSLADSTPATPLYFILSPGANVVADVDKMADKYEFVKGVSYHNVSMGQGQDKVAMHALDTAHRNGHWVILNNIHLMPRWLIELEKKLDDFAIEVSHKKFRLFLTSDPSNAIPIGILARSIKLTNEPPAGLKANLKRAFCFFPKEYIEEADSKTKSILFGLCLFHAVMMERKMYGAMGFNMKYPFSMGDLRDSATCLQNYMENAGGGKIPWADLKYIFGEIMYGGHIVNDFDRLLANSYLDFYMRDELLDEMELYPFAEDEKGMSFMSPAATSYENYIKHIDTGMTQDTPIAFGLHPNAEIDFRTTASETLFRLLMELQPRTAAASSDDGGGGASTTVETALNEILDRFQEKKFDVEELARMLDEQGPYQNVFMQEMEVMNVLVAEIVRSLKELALGFSGDLTMSDSMEALQDAIFLDRVPASWAKRAWPSLMPLALWLNNFASRLQQLEDWMANPSELPKVTWISGLVNPQSFLTAINQVAAQDKGWELDKLISFTEVKKWMAIDEVDAGVKHEGAFVIGLSVQGCRWNVQEATLEKSKPKEMFCTMPVLNVRGMSSELADNKGIYMCPCYKTLFRGPTYVFSAQLKTKSPAARWCLAGVALIMEV